MPAVKGQFFYIPDEDDAIFESQIQDSAVTGAKLATGIVNQTVSDGVDETTPTDIPVSGMEVGDEVISVLVFTTKASIATMAAHGGTLTAAADGITPGTPEDNSGNQYLVTWMDRT